LPPWATAWIQFAGGSAVRALRSIAGHTGIPISIVAALALVLSFRIARRAANLVIEVALAVALVLAATRAGWLRF
jgi:thiamine transporter ThiT